MLRSLSEEDVVLLVIVALKLTTISRAEEGLLSPVHSIQGNDTRGPLWKGS